MFPPPSGPLAAALGVIDRIARASGTTGPAPPGLPHFGLDHPSGTRLQLLDHLATRGIFRKYEHVLDLGGGLGAGTRYLAARLGCTATSTATPAEAEAAHALTVRAGLDRQVHHVAAAPAHLPFAERAFTHVWIVEVLPCLGSVEAALGEAARVLRPGGHLALQDLVHGAGPGGAEGLVDAAARRAQLERAGFVEIAVHDLSAEAIEQSPRVLGARQQLARALGDAHPTIVAQHRLGAALATGAVRVAQLTARRP